MMFGKSGDAKKIKELEEHVKHLQKTIKELNADLEYQKIEFKSIFNEFGNTSYSVIMLQKDILEIKEQLKSLQNVSPLNTIDVPNFPWLHEIISRPEGACFQCMSIHQKLKVWESIFNNIGFTANMIYSKGTHFTFQNLN